MAYQKKKTSPFLESSEFFFEDNILLIRHENYGKIGKFFQIRRNIKS